MEMERRYGARYIFGYKGENSKDKTENENKQHSWKKKLPNSKLIHESICIPVEI
jgi:hypothetical protein